MQPNRSREPSGSAKQPRWENHLQGPGAAPVGVGELGIVQGPDGMVACRAVGATVAVCFHAPGHDIAGVLHVGFPSSRQHRALSASHPLLFADRGVEHLTLLLRGRGIAPAQVTVQLVGGSGLLDTTAPLDGPARLLRAVEVALTAHGLSIRGRHTGGSQARSLHQSANGRLLLMMPGGHQ